MRIYLAWCWLCFCIGLMTGYAFLGDTVLCLIWAVLTGLWADNLNKLRREAK